MLKLYKRGRSGIRYWEAWELYGTVCIHEGIVGDGGKNRFRAPAEDQSAADFIVEAAKKPRAKGYAEIPRDEQHKVIVQYRLDSWGDLKDLKQGHTVEDVLNGCLGWTGNGRCTGHDIGSGTMNLFCLVVVAELAADTIVAALRKKKLLKNSVIAVEEAAGYRVMYPRRFKGAFAL